jgi:hypothetical protein
MDGDADDVIPHPSSRLLDSRFRRQPLDLSGKGQVVRRDSTDVVRAECERQARMSDVDIGMVIHRLGDVRNARDECDARRKRWETIRLRQRVAAPRPTWQPAKLPLDPDVGETFGHRSGFFLIPSRGFGAE